MLPNTSVARIAEANREVTAGGRYLAAFHQVDQIGDEFLRALDRQRPESAARALAACGVAHFGGEARATRIR